LAVLPTLFSDSVLSGYRYALSHLRMRRISSRRAGVIFTGEQKEFAARTSSKMSHTAIIPSTSRTMPRYRSPAVSKLHVSHEKNIPIAGIMHSERDVISKNIFENIGKSPKHIIPNILCICQVSLENAAFIHFLIK